MEETNKVKIIAFDTEATTDEGSIYKHPAQCPELLSDKVRAMCQKFKTPNPNMQEIIEFGLAAQVGDKTEKISIFVKPKVNPTLYPFTTKLTGITQEMLIDAPEFNEALGVMMKQTREKFQIGLDTPDVLFVACGDWDFKFPLTAQFLNEHYNLPDVPIALRQVCNIKVPFQQMLDQNPVMRERHEQFLVEARKTDPKVRLDMKSMLHTFGLTLDGDHHRAHDDAANVLKIARELQKMNFELKPTFTLEI